MWKKFSLFILSACAIFTMNYMMSNKSDVHYIQMTQPKVPIYAIEDDSSIIGYFTNKPTVKATKVNDSYWAVHFGYSDGLIKQQDVSSITKREIKRTMARGWQTAIIQNETAIYTKPSLQATQLAVISSNTRYPIVRKRGSNWYKVTIGDQIGFVHAKDVEQDRGVPVLMYHHLLPEDDNKKFKGVSAVTSAENFDAQMQWLFDNNYTAISLQQLEKFVKKEGNLPAKAVAITFDDGLKSTYIYGYPILKKYNFRATNFLITGRVLQEDTPAFNPDFFQPLSMAEIDVMKDVYDFQSHTHNMHRNIDGQGFVVIKSRHDVNSDFATSKYMIGAKYMAYPFGQYNSRAIQILKNNGYMLAFTIKSGKVQPGDNPYKLQRLAVNYDHTLPQFIELVHN